MREKFWSDDFDMDLLKLFPDLPETLGEVAERALWTVGHATYGRLNHPAVWNSTGALGELGAWVWTRKPNLPRKDGWFNLSGCASNDPEIECTWLELLRDQWAHHYGFVLLPAKSIFTPAPLAEFDTIMYDLRGWRKDANALPARTSVMAWLLRANRQLEAECRKVTAA
jgi:hypothetical protein